MAKNISVVIITKNEIDRIATCIQSVQEITDDIIVVDSGSLDGTVEKAREMGTVVIETQWKGYGPTKNFGFSKSKYDWVLSLDADETVSKQLLNEIKSLDLKPETVYAINRQNFYLDKAIKHSGWSPDWVFRIFDKQKVQWNDSLVHEKLIIPPGYNTIKLQGKLLHHSYRSIEDHKAKIEKYAALRAQIWIYKGKTPSIWKRNLGPIWKFFKSYVIKLGLLDGKAGWTIAKMNFYLVKRQIFHYDKLKSLKL